MLFDRILFLLVFLLYMPLVIYVPNPGGVGLALPFNLLIYGGAALLMIGMLAGATVALHCHHADQSSDSGGLPVSGAADPFYPA
ncbi:Uncharacterised protein [Serratia fonticola]|uniref:Transporter n=1 Tax=Serratia fonticola TaxID=47917 RepID=A0A4U9U2W9_SERFO|nr:Uncharacterised protein [Serratia fonticola]